MAHPFPDEKETLELGKQLIDMCRAVGTKPVVTTTWAKKAEPENQQIMIDTYKKLSESEGALLSPVGVAWQRVQRECPEIELYHKDGAHASVYGAYLNACCHYQTITGRSCVGLPYKGKDFIKDMDAERIRHQVTGIVENVDVELNADCCVKIQQIVNRVLEEM